MDFEKSLAAARQDAGGGIGTLGEKTLHLTMKYLFAPDNRTHEISVGRHIADAVTAEGIIEVQTRSLHRLRPKLDDYLQSYKVTVVYPIAADTNLIRVNASGEMLGQRRSPKHETVYMAMREVYSLRNYFRHANFRLVVVSLRMNGYILDDGKRRQRRLDREPVSLVNTHTLTNPAGFRALLPDLPEEFSAKSLGDILHIPLDTARRFLCILQELGIAATEKTQNRAKIWHIVPE